MGTPSGSTVIAIQALVYQVLGLLFCLVFHKGACHFAIPADFIFSCSKGKKNTSKKLQFRKIVYLCHTINSCLL